jgi:hypothetical protein
VASVAFILGTSPLRVLDLNDPRQGLEGAANTYSTTSDFTGINPDDINNKSLQAATNALQELIDTDTPDDT